MDPITRDFYEERRRKWRRSAFWRGFLVAAVLALIVGAVRTLGGPPLNPQIARVEITGVIYGHQDRAELLKKIAESETAAGLIVHIDSPGGTVVGSEELYEGLRAVAARKPVVAVMGGVAASGGYIAAMGGDHIIARGNSITGSIGVIFEYLTFVGLMETLGVEVETIRSSDLKAAPSQFRELTPEARAAERAIVDETFAWFQGLVAERRGLEGAALRDVTDGRTFTGRMAFEAGLVDALGDESVAVAWLESSRPDLRGLSVETWKIPEEDDGIFGFLGQLGLIGADLPRVRLPEGPRLMSILQ